MATTTPIGQLERERAGPAARDVVRPTRWREHAFDWGVNLLLLAGGVLMLAPFVWAFSTSFRLGRESFSLPPQWLPTDWRLDNYRAVLDALPFFRFVFNSFKVAALITLLQVVTCSTAAFAFARLRFRGRDALFFVFLSSLMIPQYVTIIPIFIIVRRLNLLDSHWALILPSAFSAFGIFLLRQYFLTIPRDLEDAARIDGAGFFEIYRRIMLPLVAPALVTLTIFSFNYHWNEFFRPLIFLTTWEQMTLPLGLTVLRGYLGTGNTAAVMAGVTMAITPVLLVFLLFQRYLIEGITLTGLKE
ncbi:MAG: N-acetyl-D-glucosamine ABC transporter, permease protein 2 [uncultured Thermomicrobiales bacterium]|uniref:N-acetyl-D-glucosamine ABC transporter, permease protein 2 n=1 Tax=uncultured Thermomicrobiales bacterium TaxID=1645740 RepID=A0A6J4V9U6_9BACT|nr:MAG: N-acetyl-D-glucosamine ABC transporter, permease protein 2 [uncultured Thermomicrobiales bacterium]